MRARPNNYSPITFNFFQKSMQICNMEQNINNCSKNYITYYFVNNLFFRENRYVPTYFSHLKKFIQGRTCHFHETYTTNTSPKQASPSWTVFDAKMCDESKFLTCWDWMLHPVLYDVSGGVRESFRNTSQEWVEVVKSTHTPPAFSSLFSQGKQPFRRLKRLQSAIPTRIPAS